MRIATAVLAVFFSSCASTEVAKSTSCDRTLPAASAEVVCPLLPGMAVPNVALTKLDGTSVTAQALGAEPTVFIFYRGGWCPFCNTQMQQLQAIEPDIKKAGFRIVAISPDDAAGMKASTEKHTLTYTLLSDPQLQAASQCGVAFAVTGTMAVALKAIAPQNQALPAPAVFVVRDGVVRFSYVNPDFKVRLEPSVLLAAVQAAQPR
jgi:peroxiredoxin